MQPEIDARKIYESLKCSWLNQVCIRMRYISRHLMTSTRYVVSRVSNECHVLPQPSVSIYEIFKQSTLYQVHKWKQKKLAIRKNTMTADT